MHPYHKIVRLNQRIQSAKGRLGTAPCGHVGEAVVGHYYACLAGCDDADAIPVHVEPERTKPVCAWSRDPGSDCRGEGDVVKWADEFNDINGNAMWSCRECGREFMG